MKKLTDTLNQFQVLIATVLSVFATVGVDKAGLLKTLQNPFEWTVWQALFFAAVALIIGTAVFRRHYANVSRLKDPNALRLDPAEPRHLLGRAEDIGRVTKALDRSLVFLVGELGSGKSAPLQAGICHDPEVARAFVPVYVDLTDLEWTMACWYTLRDRFRQALPEEERKSYPGGNGLKPADLMAAFDLYREKLGGGRCCCSTSSTTTRRTTFISCRSRTSEPGDRRRT